MKKLLALILASFAAQADELVIYTDYSVTTYHCSHLQYTGAASTGGAIATCQSREIWNHGDGIFNSSFELGFGGWDYEVTGSFNVTQQGCLALVFGHDTLILGCE